MKTKRLFKNIMPLIMAVALFITALPVSGIKAKAEDDSPFEPKFSFSGQKFTLIVKQPEAGKKSSDVGIVDYFYYIGGKASYSVEEKWYRVIGDGKKEKLEAGMSFMGGAYYIYVATISTSMININDFTVEIDDSPGSVKWLKDLDVEHKDDHKIICTGYTIASAVDGKNLGAYTIDLSSGSARVTGEDAKAVVYNISGSSVDGTTDRLGDGELDTGIDFDLNKDGKGDIQVTATDFSDPDMYAKIEVLSTNTVRDQAIIVLSDEMKNMLLSSGYKFYEKVILNFSAPNIDLSKGSYYTNDTKNISYFYTYYKACIDEGSIKVNEKSLTEADADLDKDGTWDINIVLTLDSAYKFVDMTITALPTCSIKTSITKSLSESTKAELDKAKYAYYREATFIFPDSKSSSSPEDDKTEETGKAEKTEKAKKVEDPAPAAHAVGEAVENGGASYTISSVDEGKEAVTYAKPDSNKVTSATIPDTITIDNKEYKVTEIAANAFKNNKKLKKITIGKNINKIGANAFFGCKNLKNIKFKTVLLTKKTVGKNAFKGVNAKAKAKVPKKVLKLYKKFLPGKGLNGKGQKITK
ncbi:leucine-rich repeat protein [Butyrivibrio sp. INlla16]|uniref:leucine-rich repeat protein n=1 Tax=Butyrivibrio sp. INlla16 TaxID=1520807 RepID=UPI000891C985|nr:leucine-rich repeat protein [Butyrivibrio sp. INlla16]SDB24079.1 Leucine rich repeat-containing protein [Butyrivibrio sp. INlla16]